MQKIEKLNMSASRQHELKPMLRIGAAVSLMVWLMAVGFCSTKCLGTDSRAESAHMEQVATTGGHSHDSDKHDDSFCDSLHSVCPVSPSVAFEKPDFGLASSLDFNSTVQLVAVAPLETSFSRQPRTREWVFTPEVSLGAASRSLAPPVI